MGSKIRSREYLLRHISDAEWKIRCAKDTIATYERRKTDYKRRLLEIAEWPDKNYIILQKYRMGRTYHSATGEYQAAYGLRVVVVKAPTSPNGKNPTKKQLLAISEYQRPVDQWSWSIGNDEARAMTAAECQISEFTRRYDAVRVDRYV